MCRYDDVNDKNEILVGKRLDHPSGHWQMPQGGIDENENPEKAVWREMLEEIGTNNATIIKESNQFLKFRFLNYMYATHKSFKE